MCSGDVPLAGSKDRRKTLPSIAMTPCVSAAKRAMKL
jgi:hypothetical protein